MRIEIFLKGQPARVTHQSGTRYPRRGRPYKTKALMVYERYLQYGLALYRPAKAISGPVKLSVKFGFQAGRKKDAGKWKTTKPDTDNMIKTVKDILTDLNFWLDDAQVTHETCLKFWTDQPGIEITIEELKEKAEESEWKKSTQPKA